MKTDKKIRNIILAITIPLFTFAGCGGNVFKNLLGGGARLYQIEVTPGTASIASGTNQQLKVTGIYGDGTKKDVTALATWEVDKPQSGYVATGGEFRSTAPDTVLVTAAYDGKTASSTITITAKVLLSIEVTPKTRSIPVGAAFQFSAIGIFTDNSTQDLTDTASWSSATTASVTIGDTDASDKGLASGVAGGSSIITATYSGKSAAATLTVTTAVLTALIITPSNEEIFVGTTVQYKATAYFNNNTNMDVTKDAAWTSSDSGIALIENTDAAFKGRTNGAGAGEATIGAEYTINGVTKNSETSLTVTAASLISIQISPDDPIAYGTTQQFKATGIFTGNIEQDITADVFWYIKDSGIATISNAAGSTGLAVTSGSGSTKVLASRLAIADIASYVWPVSDNNPDTVDPFEAVTTLEVRLVTLSSLDIVSVTGGFSSDMGDTVQLKAYGTYSDGIIQDLTSQVIWSSSNPANAEISNASGSNGLVTAILTGTTTITVTKNSITHTETFTVNTADMVKPKINPAATLLSGNRVRVIFDEDMDVASSLDPLNYVIQTTVSGSCPSIFPADPVADGVIGIDSITAISLTEFILQLSEGTGAINYKVVVNPTAVKDIAGNFLDCENIATFMGVDTVPPYIVTAINKTPTTIIVYFSEAMNLLGSDATRADKSNYTLTKLTGVSTEVPTIDSILRLDDSTYELTLGTATYEIESVNYKLTVASTVTDSVGNALTDPKYTQFTGNENLKMVSAIADPDRLHVTITYNKPVYAASAECNTTGDCAALYKITPTLGNITSATVNDNKVTLTHDTLQDGSNYTVIGANRRDNDQFDNVSADKSIQYREWVDTAYVYEDLSAAPKDRTSFLGTGPSITTPEDGPQFDDPFGDSTASGFSFVYNEKVFIGPNVTNSSLVSFDPDGRNLVQVGFDNRFYNTTLSAWEYYTNDVRNHFGYYNVSTLNPVSLAGPDGVDGVGYFASVNLTAGEYLLAGVLELDGSASKLNQIYITKDFSATLEFSKCLIDAPAGVTGTSAAYGSGNLLFLGMASDASAAGQRPGFNTITVNDVTCSGATKITSAPFSGGRSPLGIDLITSIDYSGDTYLIVANSTAFTIAKLDGDYPVAGDFKTIQPSDWTRSSTTNTTVINSMSTLQPYQRGFSALAQYGNVVYAARNRCTLTSAADTAFCSSTRLTPELWTATIPSDPVNGTWTWTKVFDAANFESGTWNIDAISLLVINGTKLYVAMDSPTQGARLVWVDLVTTTPASVNDFTQMGRGVNAACGFLDGKAFGKNCNAKRFFSGASVPYGANFYLYMSTGDGTNSMKVFKQVD